MFVDYFESSVIIFQWLMHVLPCILYINLRIYPWCASLFRVFTGLLLICFADDGEGVKADDIWNKFVSDDQNVVRAPTADSRVSGTASTQMSGSQVTGSQGT